MYVLMYSLNESLILIQYKFMMKREWAEVYTGSEQNFIERKNCLRSTLHIIACYCSEETLISASLALL